MTLWSLKKGEQGIITDFSEQLSSEIIQRLQELGLHKDRPIECMKHSFLGSPKSFRVGGTIIGLGKEIALSITIRS